MIQCALVFFAGLLLGLGQMGCETCGFSYGRPKIDLTLENWDPTLRLTVETCDAQGAHCKSTTQMVAERNVVTVSNSYEDTWTGGCEIPRRVIRLSADTCVTWERSFGESEWKKSYTADLACANAVDPDTQP